MIRTTMQMSSTVSFSWDKGNFVRAVNVKSQAGLTLIECLVAIAVIAATIGVIAPVTVLAVATRVQNQRAEQAMHIAQSEVSRVQVEVERGGSYTAKIDNRVAEAPKNKEIEDVAAPDATSDSSASPDVTKAKKIDGNPDFAVQIFRTHSDDDDMVLSESGEIAVFKLGVRVYKASAFGDPANPPQKDRASLTFTSGEGQGTNRPLAVLYSTIVKSDEKASLCDYHKYDLKANSEPLPSVCDP